MTNLLRACCHITAGKFVMPDGDFPVDEHDSLLWYKDLTVKTNGVTTAGEFTRSSPRSAATSIAKNSTSDLSIAVVQANEMLEDQSQVKMGPFGTFVGVYDGHGGPQASRFITSHLFAKIEGLAQESGSVSGNVLRRAFSETEEEFVSLVDKSWRSMPQIASVGSCCLVGVISDTKMYIANLGDSRVVLGSCKQGHMHATRLTEEHNASNIEVREELKAQHPDDSKIVVLRQGVWRVKGIIQVSRSIGDVYLKKPEVSRDPLFSHHVFLAPLKKPVLSAEPSIIERTLSVDDRFLIFASDGLWDHLSDQEAVDIVKRSPRRGIARRLVKVALGRAATKRKMTYSDIQKLEAGIRRFIHDDISVVVVYLDQRPHSLSSSSSGGGSSLWRLPRISRVMSMDRSSINAPLDISSFEFGVDDITASSPLISFSQ